MDSAEVTTPAAPIGTTDSGWPAATELAGMIAGGEVSSYEVVARYLDRIALINPSLNAMCRLVQEEALAQAAGVDESRDRGESLPPSPEFRSPSRTCTRSRAGSCAAPRGPWAT